MTTRKPRKKKAAPRKAPQTGVVAKFDGTCFSCGEKFRAGDPIAYFRDVDRTTFWGHPQCASAHREMTRNAARINAGETFAGTPGEYRRKTRRRDTR